MRENLFDVLLQEKRIVLTEKHTVKTDNYRGLCEFLAVKLINTDVADLFFEVFGVSENSLRMFMSPMDIASNNTNMDSFVRILLKIEVVQSPLLAELIRIYVRQNSFDGNLSSKLIPLHRLIISQIQWIDPIYDAKVYSEDLVQAIRMTNAEVQTDLLVALPEILTSSQHPAVASTLTDILVTDSYLFGTILDVLTNLQLGKDLFSKILHSVLSMLTTIEMNSIPTLINFLFRFVAVISSDSLSLIFNTLRSDLNLVQVLCTQDEMSLILDSLYTCIKYHPTVVPALIKFFGKLDDVLNSFDLWCLILAYNSSNPTISASIVSVLRKKVLTQQLPLDVVETTLSLNVGILEDVLGKIIHLSDSMISKLEAGIQKCGFKFLSCCFKNISKEYFKQEVVLSLISHIHSGSANVIQMSMETLLFLSKTQTKSLQSFSAFLYGLIDIMSSLSLSNARLLLTVFSRIALHYSPPTINEGASIYIDNEFCIQLRKFVSAPVYELQNLGVIGVVGLMCSLDSIMSSTEFPEQFDNLILKQMKDHFTVLQVAANKSFVIRSFVNDELSYCVRKKLLSGKSLDFIELKEWVFEGMESYLMEEGSTVESPFMICYGNDQTDSEKLSVTPFFCSVNKCPSMVALPSQLRLYGNFPECDHLIDTSFVVFDESTSSGIKGSMIHTQVVFVSSCLMSLNLLREMIGIFACSNNAKFMCRKLDFLVRITSILQNCVNELPSNILSPVGTVARPAMNDPPCASVLKLPKKTTFQMKWDIFCKHIRPMDLSSYALLSLPLSLHDEEFKISPQAMLYLVEDLHHRVSLLFKKVKSSSPDRKYVSEADTINDMKELLPYIQGLHSNVSLVIEELGRKMTRVEDGDNGVDTLLDLSPESDLENDSGSLLHIRPTSTKGSLLKILLCLFDISSILLDNDILKTVTQGKQLLTYMFLELAGVDTLTLSGSAPIHSPVSISTACTRFCTRIEAVIPWFTKFQDSFLLLRLMNSLISIASLNDSNICSYKSVISDLAKSFLGKEWKPRSCIKASLLASIIKFYIENSEFKIAPIQEIVNYAFPPILSDSMDDCEVFSATLNKTTFPCYFKAVFEELISCINEESKEVVEVLKKFETCGSVFENLITLAKSVSNKNEDILCSAVRFGRQFMESVVKQINFFKKLFNGFESEVIGSLKSIQKSSRSLHIICAHGKSIKNLSISVNIPFLKRAIEDFVCTVKIFFAENNLLGSFSLGVLKSKNIDDTLIEPVDEVEEFSCTQIVFMDKNLNNVPSKIPKKVIHKDLSEESDIEAGDLSPKEISKQSKKKSSKPKKNAKKAKVEVTEVDDELTDEDICILHEADENSDVVEEFSVKSSPAVKKSKLKENDSLSGNLSFRRNASSKKTKDKSVESEDEDNYEDLVDFFADDDDGGLSVAKKGVKKGKRKSLEINADSEEDVEHVSMVKRKSDFCAFNPDSIDLSDEEESLAELSN